MNGIYPLAANPMPMPTMFCSAIYDWNDLSGKYLEKFLGVGRILDIAVQDDDGVVDLAQTRKGVAEGKPGRRFLLIRGSLKTEGLDEFRLGNCVFGSLTNFAASTSGIGPTSLSAAWSSSSFSGLPCQPFLFSRKETPLPLMVLARITVGAPLLPIFLKAPKIALICDR